MPETAVPLIRNEEALPAKVTFVPLTVACHIEGALPPDEPESFFALSTRGRIFGEAATKMSPFSFIIEAISLPLIPSLDNSRNISFFFSRVKVALSGISLI